MIQFEPFKRTSKQPVDKSFVINDINNIDNELNKNIRYSGLIFFATIQNQFYYFDNDTDINDDTILIPKPFGNTDIINGIIYNNTTDYSNLTTVLNGLPKILGKQIQIYPLNITVIYNDNNQWIYHSGISVIDSLYWNTLASPYKKEYVKVFCPDLGKFQKVNSQKLLIDFVPVFSNLPQLEDIDNLQWFEFNGDLYIKANDTIYNVTDESSDPGYVISITLQQSLIYTDEMNNNIIDNTNIITHNLNTQNIHLSATYNQENILLNYKIIDDNNIQILTTENNFRITANITKN